MKTCKISFRLSCILMVGIGFTFSVYGQYAESDFTRYTSLDGLTENNISCIMQDSRGFLWIGTDFGLNRYDGKQFDKYYQDDPAGFLTSSHIHQIRELSEHRMAIVTRLGLQIINTDHFSIQQLEIPDTSPFSVKRNYIIDAKELQDNSIGVSTATGYYVFDTSGALTFRHDAFKDEDLGNTRLYYARQILTVPEDKAIIYIQGDSQAMYDIKTQTFEIITSKDDKWRNFIQPSVLGWRDISQISDHKYFFLTRSDSMYYYDHALGQRIGFLFPAYFQSKLSWESHIFPVNDSLYLINGGNLGFTSFLFNKKTGEIRFDGTWHLEKYKIRCFYKDKSDRLWIGTSEGILKQKIKPSSIQVFQWPVKDISRFGYSDAFRHGDTLYVSRFSRDTGLVMIDMTSMRKVKAISFYGKDHPANEVYCMEMYHPDTLWLGTNDELLWYALKSGHYGKVEDLLPEAAFAKWNTLSPPEKNGSAWLCQKLEGKVARYDLQSRSFQFFDKNSNPPLPFLEVKDVCTDANGDTWMGGHSLSRLSAETLSFDTLMKSYGGPNMHEDDIKLLRSDQEGSLWMHNFGNGLLEYDIRLKKWNWYGMKDGLPAHVIHAMSDVRNHTLWLGIQNQLVSFDTETHTVKIFNEADGIPDAKPVASNMYIDTATDLLYVFYQDRVVSLPSIQQDNFTVPTELLFNEIKINNGKTFHFPQQPLQLSFRENNLSIQYAMIDFTEGRQTTFAYRMHPGDNWTNLDQQQVLYLTNLSPGDYTLEVMASSKSGNKQTKTLAFNIAPPFWKSWWFIMLCIGFVSGILYLIYQLHMARVHQKANLDKLLSQTEMKALHAQMNPHFIFNSLNSIREMILNNEMQQASKFLTDFAHLIRLTLDQSRQSFISLRHTMEYLNRYIEMEKIRNADFSFRMELDPELDPDEAILPPMIIQPFIENAIWHGMNGAESKIHIIVRFQKQDDGLVCIIEDDGIGIEEAMQNKNGKSKIYESVGITNIRKRIELLNQRHQLESSIDILDKKTDPQHDGSGTIVKITLPREIYDA